MGKQVAQGTRLESRIVKLAQAAGRTNAKREPKTATKHEPDLLIPGKHKRPALVWENWITDPGKQRRKARRMVTITEQHFMELISLDTTAEYGYHVQCKSTQRLSVGTVLDGLIEWMEKK